MKLIRPTVLINYAPPMSPRAARAAALPFALLAAALRQGHKFWIEPMLWRLGADDLDLLLSAAGWIASAVLPIGAYLLLTRRARRRPAAFVVDVAGRRFIAPPTPRWNGAWTVFLGWLAGNTTITERVPGTDVIRLADSTVLTVVGAVASVVLLVLVTIDALWSRPFLQLSRDGIVDQRPIRRHTIGWDELVPGGPPPPATRNPVLLTVYTWTASTAGSFAPRQLPAVDWHVDPAFLAHTLRSYADHSKGRAAIGTDAELARLQATFAADPVTPAGE
jgi:hypothetical protein